MPLARMALYAQGIGISGSDGVGSPYFLPRDLRDALDWLDAHSDPSEVVVAPPYISGLIPCLSGNKVYYGHDQVTVDAFAKARRLRSFYDPREKSAYRRAFLRDNGAGYVLFWNPTPQDEDQQGGVTGGIEKALPLKETYRNRRAAVFKVGLESPAH